MTSCPWTQIALRKGDIAYASYIIALMPDPSVKNVLFQLPMHPYDCGNVCTICSENGTQLWQRGGRIASTVVEYNCSSFSFYTLHILLKQGQANMCCSLHWLEGSYLWAFMAGLFCCITNSSLHTCFNHPLGSHSRSLTRDLANVPHVFLHSPAVQFTGCIPNAELYSCHRCGRWVLCIKLWYVQTSKIQ
jgi:hypothetical protein